MTSTDPNNKRRPPRFLLNMPDELRLAMERAAFVSSRTLTAEINHRLEMSLKAEGSAGAVPASYSAPHKPLVVHTAEPVPAQGLTKTEHAMVEVFRHLPAEKQLALLSLLK